MTLLRSWVRSKRYRHTADGAERNRLTNLGVSIDDYDDRIEPIERIDRSGLSRTTNRFDRTA